MNIIFKISSSVTKYNSITGKGIKLTFALHSLEWNINSPSTLNVKKYRFSRFAFWTPLKETSQIATFPFLSEPWKFYLKSTSCDMVTPIYLVNTTFLFAIERILFSSKSTGRSICNLICKKTRHISGGA